MTYTRILLTVPSEHKDAANRLAAIFDFDVGGAATFGACQMSTDGTEPATHYMAFTVIKAEYLSILTDPQQAMVALTQLAEKYGREAPQQADVDAWVGSVIVGPVAGLRKISPEEPAV